MEDIPHAIDRHDRPTDDDLADLMMTLQRLVVQAPDGLWTPEVVASARTVTGALTERLRATRG